MKNYRRIIVLCIGLIVVYVADLASISYRPTIRYLGTYRNPARVMGNEFIGLEGGWLQRPELEWYGAVRQFKVGSRIVFEQDFDIEVTINKLKAYHQDFGFKLEDATEPNNNNKKFKLYLQSRRFIPEFNIHNAQERKQVLSIYGPFYKQVTEEQEEVLLQKMTAVAFKRFVQPRKWLVFILDYKIENEPIKPFASIEEKIPDEG